MAGPRELTLAVGPGHLSALLALPPSGVAPKAVILAVHGAGMTARYWHTEVEPGLSLLTLGASLGFAVLAVDRPGHGASVDFADEHLTREAQADLLHLARDVFARDHDCGTGFFVIAHSYGMRVGLTMAAGERGHELLGIDGSGSGLRFANVEHMPTPSTPPERRRHSAARNPWGPRDLYPRAIFSRKALPLATVPPAQVRETWSWPETLPVLAREIQIPVRLTYSEHESFYHVSDADLAEIEALFAKAPRVKVERQVRAGHNISLSWAARAYHLKALAFFEECLLAQR